MLTRTRVQLRIASEWLRRVISQPRGELDRWQKAARDAYDLGRYGARQLREDQAPLMAGALAFRTLFGLLPVLVVTTVVIRAMMSAEDFKRFINELVGSIVESFDLHEARIVLPTEVAGTIDDSTQFNGRGDGHAAAGDGAGGAGADSAPMDGGERLVGEVAEPAGVELGTWLEQVADAVHSINLGAIGWIGVAVLIYAAIGLMVTIENTFNTIYRAPAGRSWVRRVLLYWFILTLGPVALGTMFYLEGQFAEWIMQIHAGRWILLIAQYIWAFVFMWLFMFAVYILVPNTSVNVRAALAGAFVAAVLIEIGKRTFGAYLSNALSIQQLYGSLGLIPLFMFWVYLMWLVVLFGLEVSATLQALGGRRLEAIDRPRMSGELTDPASVLTLMEAASARFAKGQKATAGELAKAVGLSEAGVQRIINRLVTDQLLHEISDSDQDGYVLAQPPEQIELARLLKIGFELSNAGASDAQTRSFIEKLRTAQLGVAEGATLASINTRE